MGDVTCSTPGNPPLTDAIEKVRVEQPSQNPFFNNIGCKLTLRPVHLLITG
jgi:hypothetical protein